MIPVAGLGIAVQIGGVKDSGVRIDRKEKRLVGINIMVFMSLTRHSETPIELTRRFLDVELTAVPTPEENGTVKVEILR